MSDAVTHQFRQVLSLSLLERGPRSGDGRTLTEQRCSKDIGRWERQLAAVDIAYVRNEDELHLLSTVYRSSSHATFDDHRTGVSSPGYLSPLITTSPVRERRISLVLTKV